MLNKLEADIGYKIFNFKTYRMLLNWIKISNKENNGRISKCCSDASIRFSVSIAIPVYNEEKNIQKLLCSLALQRGIDIKETIVVNDGSTDRTLEKILKLDSGTRDSLRLQIVDLEKNKGLPNALNVIFEKACSEYLIILPSDAMLPEKDVLARLEDYLSGYDVGLVCGWYEIGIHDPLDFVGRAYRFSNCLLKRIARSYNIFGTGVIWGLPKEVYKRIRLPMDIYRVDAYIYLYVLSLKKTFLFAPEIKAVINLPKETVQRFIYRQARSRSVPQEHIEAFGELAKREFQRPNPVIILKIFFECLLQNPLDAISWTMMKMVSYTYRKMMKPRSNVKWRVLEKDKIS